MSAQKWLNCRLQDIVEQLPAEHRVSGPVIGRLLRQRDYNLKANRKTVESRQSPQRNQQFEYIQQQRQQHQEAGDPTLSVDTKKKELIGNFKNSGQVWCQEPEAVNCHDFPQDALGKAVPYGIYDLQANRGTSPAGVGKNCPGVIPATRGS
jgi:Rhodopirellula transposase DDE domain